MSDCLFCKIANGEIPSYTVYEDQEFRAFLDIEPAGPGHTLIVPKKHAANFFELPEETAVHAMQLAQRLAKAMKEVLPIDGLNIIQNNGEVAGQTVMHYHLHVIPRYQGVGGLPGWEKVTVSPEEMQEKAAALAAKLQ
jgi:histidine triad (HIT) family protein